MRYITIPDDVQIDAQNPQTGAPAKAQFPWVEYLKFLEADPRFLQNAVSVFDAIDMRAELHAAETPGAVLAITDAHHKIVEDIALKPQTMGSLLAIQAGAYARAIQDATKEKPKTAAETNTADKPPKPRKRAPATE